ncbi:MAG: fatty acid hydroxylase [Capsulimonadaceae bacterium]
MPSVFFSELGAFCLYFLYTSYFEWFLHRYVFHTPRYIYSMFRKHTLVHHQVYKGDETYHSHEDHPDHVPMNWWALPAMIAVHLPLYISVQWMTGIPSVWGGIAALSLYYTLYESLHWAMHVPRAARFLQRFSAYRFLDTHHRVHHRYMLSNLNVIFPLADATFGTLRNADGKKVSLLGLMFPARPPKVKKVLPITPTVDVRKV